MIMEIRAWIIEWKQTNVQGVGNVYQTNNS